MAGEKTRDNFIQKALKRVKTQKNLVRVVLLCLLMLLICFFIGMYHVGRIYSAFEATTYDYVFDKAAVTSKNFANDFNRKGSLVESEKVVLEGFDTISEDGICNCLKSLENSGEFEYAEYISNRNVRYYSDGSLYKMSAEQYSEYISMNDAYDVFRNPDPRSSVDELCFASAVTSNGIIRGYIIGIVEASALFENFDDESSTSVAERYLVDSKGDVVVYTKGGNLYAGSGSIYDILTSDCIDDYDKEITREEIENQLVMDEMNRRQVKVNGENGYVLFKQIAKSNGWSIFYLVYDKNIRSIIIPVLIESSASIIVIVIVLLIMVNIIIRYLNKEQRRMFELAYVDELTKAPNESAFKEKAETVLRDNTDVSYVMLCFDILNFRYINEGYGHEKADMLLRAFASAIADSISYNEVYGRIGADRFLGLMVDDGRIEDRKKFITDKIKETTDRIPMKYPIRLKIGIYYVRNRKEAVSDMIDKANLARKSITSENRTLEAEYHDKLMESTKRRETIESKMESAFENREFVPFLQPKWDMEHDHICGAEALVRWRERDGKIVPPGDFVPLFESNGFIEKIDFYMLEEICKYIRKMLDENRNVYPVSINQSRYLMYDPNYLSRVQEIIMKYRIPKGLIELELTETVFFQEKDRMIDVMRRLKELNVSLSIDDFGSGYSSLNLLREIPFDALKIDRGFLDESTQSENGRWILKKIVEMANGLNLKVICEGVENIEQVNMLLDIGCKIAQGFLYSRPIPMEEYIEKYDTVRETDE